MKIKTIFIIIFLLIGIQIFRYQTGFFPSKWMTERYQEQVEDKVKEHLIKQGYKEEKIRLIQFTKVPKARKTFSVNVVFDNGIKHCYIVKDFGETKITMSKKD